MGVDYDTVLVYGVQFSYNEVSKLRERDDIHKLIETIGTSDMVNVWSEMGEYFDIASPYFDADQAYCTYVIGWNIHGRTIDEIQDHKHEVEKKIQNICEEYGLETKKVGIVCLMNVW